MVARLRISALERDGAFQELTKRPVVAWASIVLCCIGLGLFISSTVACFRGLLSLSLAVILNTLALCSLFTPTHDAAHPAVPKSEFINYLVGSLSLFLWVPLASFPSYRWLHMQHHRFTNEQGDPDFYAGNGKWWTLPLRWLTIDLYQIIFFIRYSGRVKKSWPGVFLLWCLTGYVFYFAHLHHVLFEAVMLWLVPNRLNMMVLTFLLDYLPHYPHNVAQSDDHYRATSIRQGAEWLMTPLFVFHNYHLAHHLYPTLPFYRLTKIWRARETFHLSKNPLLVPAFNLKERRASMPESVGLSSDPL